jgi:diguanylate cyclase (GGDEF)-like protein/PAS domain S-box-containing protein
MLPKGMVAMSEDKQEQFEQALRECASEPIHQIGNIQPQGFMLVASADSPHQILQASNNLEGLLSLTAQQVLNQPLVEVLGEAALKQVEKLALVAKSKLTASGTLKITGKECVQEVKAHLYFSDGMLVLELAPEDDERRENNLAQLMLEFQESLLNTAADTNLFQYFDEIASLVRSLTSYDSVMVYRFDSNWDGEIISQERVDSAPSFLGHHFPASDIPPQARRLYTSNLVRIVADVNAVPVPIMPALNPITQQPLDLTYSALRSLSPIHIEYLRNIEVSASMVISLMQNGRLWGMIACHHLSAKNVSLAMREAAIFISRMVSGKLSSIEALEQSAKVAEANRIVSDLLNYISVDTERNILNRLLPELMTLLNATGIIMMVDGKRCLHGTVPDSSALDALLHWLGSQPPSQIFSCDQLGKLFPPAAAYADISSGILTTPLSTDMSSCIIWLRSEKPRTVKWAGNYKSGLTQNSDGDYRLTPRKSFEIWTEQWRGRSVSWSKVETGIAAMIALSLPESVAHKLRLEQAGIDRKNSEEAALAARLQLEQMTASVPGVVFQLLVTIEDEWKFNYLSSGIEELCEVGAHEAYHNKLALTDLILPEDRDAYREGVEHSAATFSIWKHDHRIRTKSGKLKWVHGAASPQRLPNGSVLWSGVLTDITERMQIQERLRLSESRMRDVFNTSLDAVIGMDEQGRITDWNSRAEEIFGWSKQEAIGLILHDTIAPEHSREAHKKGMSRYLSSGQSEVLNRRMEMVALRRCGEEFPVELSILPFKSDDIHHFTAFVSDISERRQLEVQVRQMAFFDTLTQLPNRRMLNDRLEQAMAASKRTSCYGALMFLDLDNFKPLNDKHGHVAGDLLLIEVAKRLKSCIREMDTVARFGGDEFVVMLSELEADKIAATGHARNIAEKILSTLSEPYLLTVLHDDQPTEMVKHHCTASIGITVFINHEGSGEVILKQADNAMYQAKEAGRNSIRIYEA